MTKLSFVWEGVTVEYLRSRFPPADAPPGVVVSLAIPPQPIDSPLSSHVHLTVDPNAISPNMAEPIEAILLPFNYAQTVNDPSILHLIQLLQTEIQTSQPINSMVVSSIVTILTLFLLQNARLEQDK